MTLPTPRGDGRAPGDGSGRPAGLADTSRASVLLLVGFLVSLLDTPQSLSAVIPLVAAVVYSLRAVRDQARARMPVTTLVWTLLGVVLAVGVIVSVTLPAVEAARHGAEQACLGRAQTDTARAACTE